MKKIELRTLSKDWEVWTWPLRFEKPTSQRFWPFTPEEAQIKALELCQEIAKKKGATAYQKNDYSAYCDTATHKHTARIH